MEIVGVVAGIPGVIQLVQGLTATLQGLANRRHSAKIAAELLVQLTDIEAILEDVQQRWQSNPTNNSQLQGLVPVLAQLRTEFSSLESTLRIKFSKEPSNFLRRALPLSTKLDRTLKDSLNRVIQVKTSLTLIITHHHDRVAEEHRQISSSDLRLTLRTFLRPSGDDFIPQRLDGTCEWIWSHPAFTTWINRLVSPSTDFQRRIFCLYGPKGCGKSVLVKAIAEQLRGRGEHVSHFAFWAGSETQRKFLDFLRSVLWQILSSLSEGQVRAVTSQLVVDSSINQRNVIAAIQHALAINTADFYCLVDAVDESLDDWNSRGQTCLETILDLVKSHPRLHLLVAGREPSIRTLLKESTLSLEITEDCTRSDMKRFIATELDDVLTIQSPETKRMVQRILQEQSQVMFLWTTLILNQLRRCYTAEEVKNTLEQVPHDLDREYHRLFQQLMRRASGTRTRPSASMNRARIILTSIVASPEPLTADEIRYAYATYVSTGRGLEDALIPVDGIIDACGDFLRITDGRYHLIHASLIDFLTRPPEEWHAEDSDIEYFRVDCSAAHKHMASVCVRYLELLDLGYPLTDNGGPTLASKYPFFSYAIALLPYFLARVILYGDSAWGYSEIHRVGKTPQVWAVIEYVLATIQGDKHSNADHLHYWAELASIEFDWQPRALFAIYETELRRRLHCFGPEDSRYQVLQSISALVAMFYPYWTGASTSGTVSDSIQRAPGHAGRLLEKGRLPNTLTKYLSGNVGVARQDIPQALSVFAKVFRGLAISNLKRMASDLMTLSPEVLPVPFILLMFQMAVRRCDWMSAEKLAKTALKRTRGENTFWECLSLTCLSFALLWSRTEDFEEAIQLARESIRMSAQGHSLPHFLATETVAYIILTRLLIREGKEEEARDALRSLESLVGMDRPRSGSRIAETLLRTRRGLAWRMRPLVAVADDYYERGEYADAAKLIDRAMAIWEGIPLTDHPAELTTDCLETQRIVLYDLGDMEACTVCCQRFLKFLGGLPPDRADQLTTHYRRDTYRAMGWCFARLGSFIQAREAFQQAAEGIQLLDNAKDEEYMTDLPDLAFGLLLTGDYENCVITVCKHQEPDDILDDEATLYPHAFDWLQPVVDCLEQMGAIESNYKDFLRCATLLKAAERPTCGDRTTDADWWHSKAAELHNPSIPVFQSKRLVLLLKAIDILVPCLADRMDGAFRKFRRFVFCLFEMDHAQAATLVSAEVASRYLSDHSKPLWVGFLLLADAALYDRRLEQTAHFLHLAWNVTRCGCPEHWDFPFFFAEECAGNSEIIADAEQTGGPVFTGIGPLLEQARTFLEKARELSTDMRYQDVRMQTGNEEEDDSSVAESRQSREARFEDVEWRLFTLQLGAPVVAPSKEAPPSNARSVMSKLRRVRSFTDAASDQPPVSCWRTFSRSRSLESLRGVPG
ncbi:hypothetical protein BJY00DRAFT_199928 [Aspergillus carlsbadensis]|nr:hypothetical protein BJY00DRAFT_199928 [Aspergillus carlsbadensis]